MTPGDGRGRPDGSGLKTPTKKSDTSVSQRSRLSPLAGDALAEIRRILAQRPRHFRPGPGTLSRWELGLRTRPELSRAYPRVDLREGRWPA